MQKRAITLREYLPIVYSWGFDGSYNVYLKEADYYAFTVREPANISVKPGINHNHLIFHAKCNGWWQRWGGPRKLGDCFLNDFWDVYPELRVLFQPYTEATGEIRPLSKPYPSEYYACMDFIIDCVKSMNTNNPLTNNNSPKGFAIGKLNWFITEVYDS